MRSCKNSRARVLYRGCFAKLRDITGAKREFEKSAGFAVDVAEKVKAQVAEAVKDYGEFVITVSEYVPPEAAGDKVTKDATAFWTTVQTFEQAKYIAACKKLGGGAGRRGRRGRRA